MTLIELDISMPKQPTKKTLTRKLDAVFSKVIRTAWDWTCAKCGTSYLKGSAGLDCSHIFSRTHRSVRWHPDNAVAKCCGCHRWWHGNPTEAAEWFKGLVGVQAYDELKQAKNAVFKRTLPQMVDMLDHFESELARLEGLRDKGAQGVLRVIPYD